tara:strand:- start:80 stop:946 length:867 start_codon:yes stop_codon:yes gene_type:complete
MKYISTSALAKELDINSKKLFSDLSEKGWIYRKDEQWNLTKEGKVAGGKMNYNPKFGDYIVWPSNIDLEKSINKEDTLTSTLIGKNFEISAIKVNALIAELGWIKKSNVGGWQITRNGRKKGGVEMESSTGIPYVVWDKSLLQNKSLIKSIKELKVENTVENESSTSSTDEFRKKFPAKYRTQDGHRVRSKAEVMIDDYLYLKNIAHAYERRLPIDEDVLCDFFIPEGRVYIEFWGLEENEKYQARKKKKLEIYAAEGLQLIELNDKDIESLDDVFPRKLRHFGINVS